MTGGSGGDSRPGAYGQENQRRAGPGIGGLPAVEAAEAFCHPEQQAEQGSAGMTGVMG